jgi:alkylresorcinol/alkylpyrone synthase/polyketide synthase Type III
VVVNSLFGDGAGAAILRCDESDTWETGPIVADFEPHIVTEAIDAMKYELDGTKLSFYLDRDIPYVIGRNVEKPIQRLLGRHGLRIRDVDHWLIHSGGKKVIDAIEYNLGLTDYDVRHTLSVLKNHGNLSSGSVLFSFKELRREGAIAEGDIGVLIAMGPGTSIETALLTW